MSKFSLATAEVCKGSSKLASVKDWAWNRMYLDLYNNAEKIIKKTHAGNIMMLLDSYTWKLIYEVSALEPDYHR